MERCIAHLDCDAFFYSVECLRDPTLIGKPVIVASSGPRAVVTTASYEARKYGVGSAMPVVKAKRLCPQALLVPPHHTDYKEKSKEVWNLVKNNLGKKLQQVSVDEAYIDLSGIEDAIALLKQTADKVKQETQITISVGVGPSKLVAKCCSDYDKPAGFVVMSREEAVKNFASAPARTLPGIGPKTASNLLDLGVVTIGHLQQASEVALVEKFGPRYGHELKQRAYFYDNSPVETEQVIKSQSAETTFAEDVSDRTKQLETIQELAEKLALALKKKENKGRTIGIKIRLDDWTTVTRDKTLNELIDDAETIYCVAKDLFLDYDPQRPVRLLGVRMSSFTPPAFKKTKVLKPLRRQKVSAQMRLPFMD